MADKAKRTSQPKLHHYLAQFYLDGFCRDGELWVFDRKEVDFRPQPTQTTAAEQHLYSWILPDGSKDTALESRLFGAVDGPQNKIIAKLESRQPITIEEKETLAFFAAFIKFRTPEFRRNFNHAASALGRRLAEHVATGPDIPEDLREFALSDKYRVTTHPNAWLDSMMEFALELTPLLRDLDWAVVHAPAGHHFITTDVPFVVHGPPGRHGAAPGIMAIGAQKYLPLTQNTCLVMLDAGPKLGHKSVNAEEVRNVNLLMAYKCERFVIGPDEAVLRDVVHATGIDKSTADFRIRVT